MTRSASFISRATGTLPFGETVAVMDDLASQGVVRLAIMTDKIRSSPPDRRTSKPRSPFRGAVCGPGGPGSPRWRRSSPCTAPGSSDTAGTPSDFVFPARGCCDTPVIALGDDAQEQTAQDPIGRAAAACRAGRPAARVVPPPPPPVAAEAPPSPVAPPKPRSEPTKPPRGDPRPPRPVQRKARAPTNCPPQEARQAVHQGVTSGAEAGGVSRPNSARW